LLFVQIGRIRSPSGDKEEKCATNVLPKNPGLLSSIFKSAGSEKNIYMANITHLF